MEVKRTSEHRVMGCERHKHARVSPQASRVRLPSLAWRTPSRKFKRNHVCAIRDGCHRDPYPVLANQPHEGEGQPTVPGDGHEKELDSCRHHLACHRLVCARRWCCSADPTQLSAHVEDAMTHSWRPNPVALRPTWQGNLLMLVVALVVVLAVAS